VRFLAGLELKLMHLGLKALAWPVRLGLVSSLLPLSRTLKWVADRLERFGSDRGGMLVRAIGHLPDGNTVERRWTLVAEEGDGPEVPPTPAFLICRRLLDGMVTRSAHEQEDIATSAPTRDRQAPSACDAASGSRKAVGLPEGAYPAVGILSLREVEAGLAPFAIRFGREEHPAVPMLEQVLGKEARTMPAAWRRLADIHDRDHFAGEASVTRGEGLLSRLVGFALGFPAASERCEVGRAASTAGRSARICPAGPATARAFCGNVSGRFPSSYAYMLPTTASSGRSCRGASSGCRYR
jgi:hypothetical protein